MDIEDFRNKTDWNGGEFKNIRIHNIIDGINTCRHTLNIQDWLYYLQDFSMELNGHKTEKEQEELIQKMKQIADKVNKHSRISKIPRLKRLPVNAQLIDDLNEMETRLWSIFTKSGLETRLMEDASNALR